MKRLEHKPTQRLFQPFGEGYAGGGNQEASLRKQNPSNLPSIMQPLLRRMQEVLEDRAGKPGFIDEYSLLWSDMILETSKGLIQEDVHRKIVNVSHTLDFVLFDQLGFWLQKEILYDNAQHVKHSGIDRFILTYEEGLLLQSAAAIVNIHYDPGGSEDIPENLAKRTFLFADLEKKVKEKSLPSELDSIIDTEK